MKRKVLASLLLLVMVLSMLPTTVFAADDMTEVAFADDMPDVGFKVQFNERSVQGAGRPEEEYLTSGSTLEAYTDLYESVYLRPYIVGEKFPPGSIDWGATTYYTWEFQNVVNGVVQQGSSAPFNRENVYKRLNAGNQNDYWKIIARDPDTDERLKENNSCYRVIIRKYQVSGFGPSPAWDTCIGQSSMDLHVRMTRVTLSSIQVTEQPTKQEYAEQEALDLSGLAVTLNYSDGTSKQVAFEEFEENGIFTSPVDGTSLQAGTITVTVSKDGLNDTFGIDVHPMPQVEAPTFSPAGGTYTQPQSVEILTETPGAVIYYTTDGSTPTTASEPYASPIQVDQSIEIQAIAVNNGMKNSMVSSASYIIQEVPPVAQYTLTVTNGSGSGAYAAGTSVAITANAAPSGKVFDQWVSSDGGRFADFYSAETTFTMPCNHVTVTATYKDEGSIVDPDPGDRDKYTLYYHSNFDGDKRFYQSGNNSRMEVRDYDDMSFLPEREGYTFICWNTQEDGRGTDYEPGDTYRMGGCVGHLYAQWAQDGYLPGDTGASDWLDTVNHAAYLSGYPDSSFGPDRNMTRAEAAQMFYSLLLDKDVKITQTFTDVPADAWYAKAVNTLASLGMLGGYPDGTFQPNRTITRAEFAVVALAFTDGGSGASCSFTDVSRNDWFYQYAAQASEYGCIGGYPDGSFRPNNKITRAEASVIVNNMLGRNADERFIDRNTSELVRFIDLTDGHWAYYAIMEAANTHTHTQDGSTEVWTGI